MATYKTISASDLIEKAQYALKNRWGYIWGGRGQIWTQAAQNAATREQTRLYGQQWVGKHVVDCSGLFYWAYKELGSYMYHGSNTMWGKYCASKGTMKSGKRTDGAILKPGTAIFTGSDSDKGHVGLYIGGDTVIEAAGTKSGVITSKITATKWKYWGELIHTDYSGASSNIPASKPQPPSEQPAITVTYPTIRQGARGEIVTQLQDLLAKAGSNLKIDGIFGSGTASAVRAFQKKYGLVVDGIVGPKTWTKLLEVAGNIKIPEAPKPEELVTLIIPDLKLSEAEELIKKYPNATKKYG